MCLSHICFCLSIPLVSTLSLSLHGLQLVFFSYSWVCALPWSVVNKENLSKSYQMLKAPQLVVEFCFYFPSSVLGFCMA